MMLDDTIAAIATPIGEAGLAMIRISGADALGVAGRCFSGGRDSSRPLANVATHTLHYGHVVHQGRRVDEVLAAVMRAPRTFTRQDTVEITCHGGLLAAKSVLDAVLAAGARLAEPGEFTKRAFLNGRIDLAQAEAVMDLIHARTELSLAAANEQLAGTLSRRVDRLRDDLMLILSHVEAHIDFPDEDIAPDTRDALLARLRGVLEGMDALLRTAKEGQILRRGVRAVIVGRPNVGKSSLLNQLLGRDRAIVSPVAGTTRDTVEETANIRGLPVVLVDTAGLREGADGVELEGIRRSRESLDSADLVLQVIDASQPPAPEEEILMHETFTKSRLVIRNKIDLPGCVPFDPGLKAIVVNVSAATGEGIEVLKDAIKERIWSGEIQAEMLEVMINARHQDALRRAREAALRTQESLSGGVPLDLVAVDLQIAVNAVGEIVGKTTTEDLLDSIFRQFCIGK